MNWIELGRDLGVFGIIAFVIQHLISKSADRKFESYKTDLDHQTRTFQTSLDSKMEVYRAEISFKNYKDTKVYERQLNVIVEIYQMLVVLNMSMAEMTSPLKEGTSKEELEKKEIKLMDAASDAYNNYMTFLEENLIFLPQNTVDNLQKIRNGFFDSYSDYTFGRKYNLNELDTKRNAYNAVEIVKNKIQPAIDQMINEFRRLIGVNVDAN